MEYLLLLALSIAPGVYLVYRYYSKDIYKKEPWVVIWKSFFWGAAMVIPAGLLESSIEFPGKDTLTGMVIENFFVIALTEELCKFIVIRFYSYRSVHFDEVMDGIVYGVAVSSGFATFENIFYVMQHGLAVGMLRAVLSVPSHIFEGAILGYWLAKSRFQNTSLIYGSVVSLLIVVIGHGFFDFVLTYNKAEYSYLSLIPVILLGWLVTIYVKNALAHDVKYIHVSENITVVHVISETTSLPNEGESSSYSKVNTTVISPVSYLQRLIYISLYFLAIVCFLTAAFFMIGFVALLQEKKEEMWTLALPLIPFIIGIYFIYRAKKVKRG
jgi:RsiW-degrading membrane proteinase PrsW (M82 family)